MDPNESWKNLLLALREGDEQAAEEYAARIARWRYWALPKMPKGLQAALDALEVSE